MYYIHNYFKECLLKVLYVFVIPNAKKEKKKKRTIIATILFNVVFFLFAVLKDFSEDIFFIVFITNVFVVVLKFCFLLSVLLFNNNLILFKLVSFYYLKINNSFKTLIYVRAK